MLLWAPYAIHLLVWVVAFTLYRHLEWHFDFAVRTVSSRRLNEAGIAKLAEPLDSFEAYFDLVSSAFIFVGLVGTIVGFAGSLNQLQDQLRLQLVQPLGVESARGVDFDGLRRALFVSAAGITQSLLLNVLVSLYYGRKVNPFLQSLRVQVSEESVADILRTGINKLSLELGQTVSTVLVKYPEASKDLAAAAELMADASLNAATRFSTVLDEASKAFSKLDNTVTKTSKLPDDVAERLQAAFGVINKALEETSRQQVLLLKAAGEAYIHQAGKGNQKLLDGAQGLSEKLGEIQGKLGTLPATMTQRTRVLMKAYGEALQQEHGQITEAFVQSLSRWRDEVQSLCGYARNEIVQLIEQTHNQHRAMLALEFASLRDELARSQQELEKALANLTLRAQTGLTPPDLILSEFRGTSRDGSPPRTQNPGHSLPVGDPDELILEEKPAPSGSPKGKV